MSYYKTKEGHKVFYNYLNKCSKKPVLVFIHGWLANWTVFEKEIEQLSKRNPLLYVDLRGHGKSDVPKQITSYSIEKMEEDVSEIIKKEGIKKAIIIGHSMGGMVAMLFATKNPSITKKLVLISTTYRNPLETTGIKFLKNNKGLLQIMAYQLAKGTKPKHKSKEIDFSKLKINSDMNILMKGLKNTELHAWISSLDEMFYFNMGKKMSKIKCPTLVIHGNKDLLFSHKLEETMTKKIHKAKLKTEEGEHFIIVQNPKQITKDISSFIN
jgi:3-oxoadipate enol-lactonase